MSFFRNYPTRTYNFNGESTNYNVVDLLRRTDLTNKVKEDQVLYYLHTMQGGEFPEVASYNQYNNMDHYWMLLYLNERTSPFEDWYLSSVGFSKKIELLFPGSSLFLNLNDAVTFTVGATVTFGNGETATVDEWDPTYRRLVVTGYSGTDISDTLNQTVTETDSSVVKKVVEYSRSAVHHFEGNVTVDGETIFSGQVLNPCDYISAYIGGSETNVITNEEWLTSQNDDLQKIKILNADQLTKVTSEFIRLINL